MFSLFPSTHRAIFDVPHERIGVRTLFSGTVFFRLRYVNCTVLFHVGMYSGKQILVQAAFTVLRQRRMSFLSTLNC